MTVVGGTFRSFCCFLSSVTVVVLAVMSLIVVCAAFDGVVVDCLMHEAVGITAIDDGKVDDLSQLTEGLSNRCWSVEGLLFSSVTTLRLAAICGLEGVLSWLLKTSVGLWYLV